MSGSVSTRTANRQAELVTASGQLRLPACCGAVPAKSRTSRSPLHERAQAQHEVSLGRLEHVLGLAHAVGQRGEAGTRAALGVVEHRVGRLAQPIGAQPVRELGEPQRAAAVGRELGAEVGAALLGLARARGDLLDRLGVERAR